jgi:hypothetical protein
MEMEIDPLDTIEQATSAREESTTISLNMLVAVTVAVLATFMGVCKVKDDNIVQGMQQAQANKIDHWSFYQARNIREEVAHATLVQLKLSAASAPAAQQSKYRDAIVAYEKLADEQQKKKKELERQAAQDQQDYDAANFRDDQFDLSDALLAIAISLLAVTSLTRQRWLYAVALIPTAFGILMGLSGLLGWGIHPAALTRLLS